LKYHDCEGQAMPQKELVKLGQRLGNNLLAHFKTPCELEGKNRLVKILT